jgi:hypothetical protein
MEIERETGADLLALTLQIRPESHQSDFKQSIALWLRIAEESLKDWNWVELPLNQVRGG